MADPSNFLHEHPGILWGGIGGAVLGVGVLLLKGKGSSGQASAFPPQYTLGGLTQGGDGVPGAGTPPVAVGCPTGYHYDTATRQCVADLIQRHPGPQPPPDPVGRHPGPQPPPIGVPPGGPDPVEYTPPVGAGPGYSPFFTPTIGASDSLVGNVRALTGARNAMDMSE